MGGGAVSAAATGGASLAGGAAAAARGGATLAGGASTAIRASAAGQSGLASTASGLGGVARAAGRAAISPPRRAASDASERLRPNFEADRKSTRLDFHHKSPHRLPSSA